MTNIIKIVLHFSANCLVKAKQWLLHRTPKGLYARSLIIIIAPMVLLQSVIAYIFMERHWQMVTEHLSMAVVRDISVMIDTLETYSQINDYENVVRIKQQHIELNISILPSSPLPAPNSKPFFAILDCCLREEITRQIKRPFWIGTVGNSDFVEIRIKLENCILRVLATRSQTCASNTGIFLSWMVGTAFVLLIIAIFFLHQQIKPIQQLAQAADRFGRGHPLPEEFSPQGAIEVRRAGIAFLRMSERIKRQMEQRTTMLSGVSHDLRTILTRFKLQLALASDNFDSAPLDQDISDMQKMLEGYLAFARDEGAEAIDQLDLQQLMHKIKHEAILRKHGFQYHLTGDPLIIVRPQAFTRLIINLMSNAFCHAKNTIIAIDHKREHLTITIDDDGAGIAENMREEVFKPFFRLDEARNQDASGTGLGLAIARDIARSHGGNVTLVQSPQGGVRAQVTMPL